jgi:hypothetical protein
MCGNNLQVRKVAVIASASGNGNTTLGRELARSLARLHVVRLRTPAAVERFLSESARPRVR